VSAFADEIGDHPMLLALLNGLEVQGQQLSAAQPAADQHRDHRVIAQLAWSGWHRTLEEPSALLGREPVPEPHADAPHTLDSTNAGCQFGA
jgi:hypothetical protein